MKTQAIELYYELRKIDPSPLFIEGVKEITLPKLIANLSRFIGSEFDKSLKIIIGELNETRNVENANLSFCIDQLSKEKITHRFISSQSKCTKGTTKYFDLEKYLDSYDFQNSFNYGITKKNEIFQCQEYLNKLLRSLDLEKIISKDLIISGLGISVSHKIQDNPNGTGDCGFISGYPDLIIDDRLIDIKSDIKINGRKHKYVAQLIFYYFLTQLYIDSVKSENTENNLCLKEIQKIGIYYVTYNKIIEVDIEKIIPNKSKLFELIKNEIIYGNYYIRDIIEKSMLRIPLNNDELKQLEKKIEKRKDKLYQTWDKKQFDFFEKRLQEINSALEYYKERMLPSHFEKYKIRVENSLQEAILYKERAKLFIMKIDNEILNIKLEIINKYAGEKNFNTEKLSLIFKRLDSIEFRRLLIIRKHISCKIGQFSEKQSLSETKTIEQLEFINTQIQLYYM